MTPGDDCNREVQLATLARIVEELRATDSLLQGQITKLRDEVMNGHQHVCNKIDELKTTMSACDKDTSVKLASLREAHEGGRRLSDRWLDLLVLAGSGVAVALLIRVVGW